MGYELVSIDEASFQLQTGYKRIWFPRGEKPRRAFFWSNKKLTVFGALTSSSKFHYDFFVAQNSLTFCFFLESLFVWLDPNKKYVFVMDNAGFHKTDVVKCLLEEHKEWISVEYIPPYSPELNPIETCWKVTKNAVTKSQHFDTINLMQEALEGFWSDHIFTQKFMRYLCRYYKVILQLSKALLSSSRALSKCSRPPPVTSSHYVRELLDSNDRWHARPSGSGRSH